MLHGTVHIHFLLPAYNEATTLASQLHKLLELGKQLQMACTIHVINDGSSDGTAAVVQGLSQTIDAVQLVNHEKNFGPGKAFDTGFRHILKSAADGDVIISMDADNTHSEQTVRMMIARIAEGYELVIASVYAPGGMFIGVPWLRYLLSHACNFCYRCLFPITGIKEYTGFYRAIQVAALKRSLKLYDEKKQPLISVNGFGCAAEMLIKFRRVPLFMIEVPMLVRYDKKGSKSKLRIGRTIREHLKIMAANVFKRHVY